MILPLVLAAATPALSIPSGNETLARAEAAATANHRRFDLNGDGFVTRAELAASIQRLTKGLPVPGTDPQHPLPPSSEAVFTAADTNHDGRLSLDESLAAARHSFAEQDSNHDGVVTPDERMAYIKRQMERRYPKTAALPAR